MQRNEYEPWGEVSRSEGATPGSSPTVDLNHRFTGQELDPETGLHYYGGRYYDQETGRFVSPDPYVQEPDNPQNLNRYTYVLNNPQNYVDPSGHFWELFIAGFVAAATVAAEFAAPAVISAELAKAIGLSVVSLAGLSFQYSMEAMRQSELQGLRESRAASIQNHANHALPKGNQALSRNIPSGDNVPGKDQESWWRNNNWSWVSDADAAQFPKGSADPRRGSGPFTQATKDSVRTGTCAGCGDQTTRSPGPNQSNIGHNIPRARGGDRSALNAIEFCRDCNQDMFILTPEEHARRLELTGQGRLRTTPQDPVRQQRIQDKRNKWIWRWGGSDD